MRNMKRQDDFLAMGMYVSTTLTLSGAHLFEIDLSHVLLYDANLSGADLTLANLRGALLEGSDLSGACLAAAQIQHTDLTGANLIGTNFSRTNPWEALLYRIPDNIKRLQAELPSQGTVTSVGDLLTNCRVLRNHYSSDNRIPTNWLEIRRLQEEGPVITEVLFISEASLVVASLGATSFLDASEQPLQTAQLGRRDVA